MALLAAALLGAAAAAGCRGNDLADAGGGPAIPFANGDVAAGEELVITITAEGDRYLNDGDRHRNQAPVSRRELIQVLADTAEEAPDMPIRVDIDRHVRYYHLMDIFDKLELYGLRNLHLRTWHGGRDHDEK